MHLTPTRKLRALAAMVTLLVLIVGAAGATVPSLPDPMGAVKHGVDQVLAVFRDPAISLKARREKLRQLSAQHFDFADMARSSLGYHWRTLTRARALLRNPSCGLSQSRDGPNAVIEIVAPDLAVMISTV